MKKSTKHPKTYLTKVFMGEQETYIVSTCAQAIRVYDPKIVWGKNRQTTLTVEASPSITLYEDV